MVSMVGKIMAAYTIYLEERLIWGLRLNILIVFGNLSLKCPYDALRQHRLNYYRYCSQLTLSLGNVLGMFLNFTKNSALTLLTKKKKSVHVSYILAHFVAVLYKATKWKSQIVRPMGNVSNHHVAGRKQVLEVRVEGKLSNLQTVYS